MNTLILRMPDAMARDVAKATDLLKMPSNEAFVFDVFSLALKTVVGRRGRPYKHKPLAVRARANAPRGGKATK